MLRFVAIALIAAAAAQAAKIDVSHASSTITLKKGRSETVTFSLSQPIICPPDVGTECAVVIELTNPNEKKVALDNCIIKWTAEEWHQKRYLKVSAVENFVNDGNWEGVVKTSVVITEADYYKGENPADVKVKTLAGRSAHCSGTGDPHYTTFDGAYWHVYQAGRYVLYSNPYLDFEVQVATRAYPARHCAYAAREGNDLFYVNACSGRIVYNRICGSEECKKGGYPKIGVNGGRSGTYSVTFKSGRSISASASPYYMNMYATAPGLDYQSGTEGICGNFDGNKGNDYNVYKTTNINSQLKSGQLPTFNLFNWRPSSIIPTPTAAPHSKECKYIPPTVIRPVLTQPDVEDITDIIKNNEEEANDDGEIIFDFTDGMADDGIVAIEMDEAIATCRQHLQNSRAYEACKAVFADFDIQPYVDDCAADFSETGEESFIEGSIEDMQAECAAQAERDVSTWETDVDGNSIASNAEIAAAFCFN
jgi:hypothetical protein